MRVSCMAAGLAARLCLAQEQEVPLAWRFARTQESSCALSLSDVCLTLSQPRTHHGFVCCLKGNHFSAFHY